MNKTSKIQSPSEQSLIQVWVFPQWKMTEAGWKGSFMWQWWYYQALPGVRLRKWLKDHCGGIAILRKSGKKTQKKPQSKSNKWQSKWQEITQGCQDSLISRWYWRGMMGDNQYYVHIWQNGYQNWERCGSLAGCSCCLWTSVQWATDEDSKSIWFVSVLSWVRTQPVKHVKTLKKNIRVS